VPVVVTAVEASVDVQPGVTGNYVAFTIKNAEVMSGFTLLCISYADPLQSSSGWFYDILGSGNVRIGTDTSTSGTMRMELTAVGDDVQWVATCPSGTASGTAVGANATGSWNEVLLGGVSATYGYSRFLSTSIDHGITSTYPWDDNSEIDDWPISKPEFFEVSGGALQLVSGKTNGAMGQQFTTVALGAISSALSPPSIQRLVAVGGAGQMQDRYASGALADILTGSIADNHPELLHVGAGAHHLGLVWQRSNDIAMTTGTGVPGAGGWPNTVQTVALDRSKPTACVISPTHDVGLAYLQSGSIALFCPASWANGSYALGTESIIASGGVASERGQILWTPQGSLIYVYRNTDGDIVTKQSTDRGNTWS
jgi:hypothetical protein